MVRVAPKTQLKSCISKAPKTQMLECLLYYVHQGFASASYLEHFQPILFFFKLRIRVDIGKKWFRIVDG